MPQDPDFGPWLRLRRKELDLTQDALAERIGCSRDTIQKIEAGSRRPSRQVAELLGARLGIASEERPAFVYWARLGGTSIPIQAMSPSAPLGSSARPGQPAGPRPRSNLPGLLTPLIGREREVEAIRCCLLRDDVRLLTLIGPPGIGKTRLSIGSAAGLVKVFQAGVYFVPLDSLTDSSQLLTAIAQSLGLDQGARESTADGIVQFLLDKEVLLLLDNFEQILDAGSHVTRILSACPGSKVMVTSREPLHTYGEWRFPVPPLALPQPEDFSNPDALGRVAAVALYTQRAQALDLGFMLTCENAAVVADICIQAEGLPLAIELAAAQAGRLSPYQIRAGLGDRLKLLKGGPRDHPPRQQSLRGAIDWSYHLLTGAERLLLRRLSVFAGGCGLDAAEAVCDSQGDLSVDVEEGIARLVNKSLLRREAGPEGELRVSMLESIRQYAAEKLEASGEGEEIYRLHAEYYLALTEYISPRLAGATPAGIVERLEDEYDNLRAAVAWSARRGGASAQIAFRLNTALARFRYLSGRPGEDRRDGFAPSERARHDWTLARAGVGAPQGRQRRGVESGPAAA
ncbi:MAG: ATP-binding protein [Rudaea sp.]